MTKDGFFTAPMAIGLSLLSALAGGAIVSAVASARLQSPVKRGKSAKPWRMSKWVIHDKFFKCQGLVGQGNTVGEQTADALQRLDNILTEAGLSKQDLLSVSIYLSDYDHKFDAMNQVYDAWVDQENAPVRICVQAYMGPQYHVEIQAEARAD